MTSNVSHSEFQIVASDLDGTLLAPNHQISEFSKTTMKSLHEKGLHFIFATGRHHVDVAGIRGQVGVHATEDNLVYSQNVPGALVQSIIEIIIHMYQDDLWLLDREDEKLKNFHEEALNEHYGDKLNVAFSTPWCLEVMAVGVSKGDALEAGATRTMRLLTILKIICFLLDKSSYS
jgi:hydroxymethylpyrimidine pyrophosphatase-like HAD family hydrolase